MLADQLSCCPGLGALDAVWYRRVARRQHDIFTRHWQWARL